MLGRRTACVWTAVAPPGTRGLSRFLAAKKKQRNRVDESMVAEQMAKLQVRFLHRGEPALTAPRLSDQG